MTGVEPLVALGIGTQTASVISAITTVVPAIMSVGSAFASMGAERQSNKYELQALVNQTNAEIASEKYNQNIERVNAANEERQLRREQYLRAGKQIAAAGAQGRGISGNVLDIMADTAYQTELAITGIRDNRQLSAGLSESKIAAARSSLGYTSAAKATANQATILGKIPKISSSLSTLGEDVQSAYTTLKSSF